MKPTLIFLALLGLLIVFLNHQFPDALEQGDGEFRLVYIVTLLVLVGSSIVSSMQHEWRTQLKYASWWIGIFFVCMVGYTYGNHLLDSKLGAELVPGRTAMQSDGTLTLHARTDGHFYINARVNGQKLRFMIDTGASDIMLTKQTAERIGLVIRADAKKQIYSTANGISAGLEVVIPRMQIGEYTLSNVTAYVSQGDTDTNLLGQSFMNGLSSYSVEDGKMRLVP